MSAVNLAIGAACMILVLACAYVSPIGYVHSHKRHVSAEWGEGSGTLRIHRISGFIDKRCYSPADIDGTGVYWACVGKAKTVEEKNKIIAYFRALRRIERTESEKRSDIPITLDKLKEGLS